MWWRLKSPASPLFTQPFIQAQMKENIKAPRHWPLWGKFTGDRWILAKMASNSKNISIWWHHHVCGHLATLYTNKSVPGEILYRLSNRNTEVFSITVFDYIVKIMCFLYSHVLQYWLIGTQAITWSTTIQHKAWFVFIILDVYFIGARFVPGF